MKTTNGKHRRGRRGIPWMAVAVGIAYAVVAWSLKRKRLMVKYGDANLVNRLMRRMFWHGMSAEQLIDSLGRPVSIDDQVLRTKTKQVWKCN